MKPMTRNEHWTEAQRLLGQVKDRNLTEREVTETLAEAQVHATLAAAPHEVVGEGYGPERRVLSQEDMLQEKLERALVELERRGRVATTATEAAAFIRTWMGEGR